jgi:hypothetical protein
VVSLVCWLQTANNLGFGVLALLAEIEICQIFGQQQCHETWESSREFCPEEPKTTQPPCKTSDGSTTLQTNHGQIRPCNQHESCIISSTESYSINKSAVFITE